MKLCYAAWLLLEVSRLHSHLTHCIHAYLNKRQEGHTIQTDPGTQWWLERAREHGKAIKNTTANYQQEITWTHGELALHA